MKTLVWTPGTLAPSVIKGGKTSVSSILSVNSGGVLVKPGVLTPVPGAPYSVKSLTGGLHIHPAFTFEAGVRYWITAGKSVTTDKDEAVYYMGEGVSGGMLSDPKPLQLSITTVPGNISPDDVVIVEYDYSAVWNVEVYYQINSGDPVFYGTYEATGSVSVDTTGIEFEHNDQFTVIIKDLDSTLSDNITYNVIVKAIEDVVVGDLYLIGEFEEGVDYYATPDGEITTDITGIYLGVGNADGDIDLDIIEYEMTMTYPAGSEEIGLDIPFDVTAATNLQDGREVLIYAKKTGVSEHIGTATVSGGAISESVSIPSSAFTAEDTVTIELNYASGAVTDSNDVTTKTATITNVTSTPASPEPATNFELSGESTYLVGEELTLQYSTDDSTWLPLGVVTVQGDGTWSKADCQIATAGTYYLRAVYDTDKVESASISVVVESGETYLITDDDKYLIDDDDNKLII